MTKGMTFDDAAKTIDAEFYDFLIARYQSMYEQQRYFGMSILIIAQSKTTFKIALFRLMTLGLCL
jgi:hypothetical protein